MPSCYIPVALIALLGLSKKDSYSVTCSMEFAIHHMTIQKRWTDSVVNAVTIEQLEVLRSWLQRHKEIIDTKNKWQHGYHALFWTSRYGQEPCGYCAGQ